MSAAMKQILLALLFLILTRPARAYSTNYWIVCVSPTGDVAIGHSTGGVCTVCGVVTKRRATSTRKASVTTVVFTGGKVSKQTTWAQFSAAEGMR
jgi:predicted MFS family arabinose efflux permease